MEVVGRNQRPPSMEALDGDGSCRPKEQETSIIRGQKAKRIKRKVGPPWIEQKRNHIHTDIHIDYRSDQLIRVPKTAGPEVIFPPRPGARGAAVWTPRLTRADELSAIGTKH